MEFETQADYTDEVYAAVDEAARADVAAAMRDRRQDRAQQPARRARSRRHRQAGGHPRSPGEFDGRRWSSEPFRSLQKEVVRKPHRQRGRPHRRPRHDRDPAAVGPGRHPPHRPRHGPVPAGRDPGAHVTTLGMPRMAQMLDTIGIDDTQALHAQLQLPAVLHRRDRPGAAPPNGVRSATAPSPSGPWSRWSPPRGVPLHAAGRLRRARLQRLDVDGVGVRFDPVADGRRRAHQGAGGRHRHGPRLRRRQVHDPDRHPRGRGRLRRHGLQGGGHGRVRHRPPARHQDRRAPRRGARPRAEPGQGRPGCRSST